MGAKAEKREMFVTSPQFYRTIVLLSVPIILQQLLRVSVDTLDSIMLGRIDQVQMSAVSQAQQIFFIFYTVCSGFSAGCSVLIAQYWGRRDTESIKTLVAIGVRSIAVFGVLFSAVVMIWPERLLRIYSSDPELIRLGVPYLRIASLMYPVCAVSTMIFACCRGFEEMKVSFTTNVISYPLNVFLDFCLIFGNFGMPELGIRGAAVGTVIARVVELLILCRFLFRKEKKLSMKFSDLKRRDRRLLGDFWKVGLPIVFHELIWSTGTTAGSSVTGQMGTTIVAGYNIANVYYQLMACVTNAILYSCSTTIGKTIGSGASKDRIQKEAYSMVLIGLVSGTLTGLLTLDVRRPVHAAVCADSGCSGLCQKLYAGVCGHLALLWYGDDRHDRSAEGRRRRKDGADLRYLFHVDDHHSPGGCLRFCVPAVSLSGGIHHQVQYCHRGLCGNLENSYKKMDAKSHKMMYNGSMNKKTENQRRKLCIFHRISIGRAHGLIKIIKIFNQEEGGLQ